MINLFELNNIHKNNKAGKMIRGLIVKNKLIVLLFYVFFSLGCMKEK